MFEDPKVDSAPLTRYLRSGYKAQSAPRVGTFLPLTKREDQNNYPRQTGRKDVDDHTRGNYTTFLTRYCNWQIRTTAFRVFKSYHHQHASLPRLLFHRLVRLNQPPKSLRYTHARSRKRPLKPRAHRSPDILLHCFRQIVPTRRPGPRRNRQRPRRKAGRSRSSPETWESDSLLFGGCCLRTRDVDV